MMEVSELTKDELYELEHFRTGFEDISWTTVVPQDVMFAMFNKLSEYVIVNKVRIVFHYFSLFGIIIFKPIYDIFFKSIFQDENRKFRLEDVKRLFIWRYLETTPPLPREDRSEILFNPVS
jgi:hypothetical protein